MNDYARIAAEEMVRQQQAAIEAEQWYQHQNAVRFFFKSLEFDLAREVQRANPELERFGLLVADRTAGITLGVDSEVNRISLAYGSKRFGSLQLDPQGFHLWMILQDAVGEPQIPPPVQIPFRIALINGAVRAILEGLGGSGIREFDAQQIAVEVVTWMIRGTFE